ncbi:hypothetical protein [Corynebacterium epidermidicanis]|uniref:EcsC protein family n=1 Tax=Corynebacterium epidermidicanis TaxID=1050174 RepID=A0A0G3GTG6_9CORY|nr:hypothetical protein [Corynebacterium epidermidicanis]AKK02838.1 hypothetical protein CEPID_04840 [Corynebacterium epidermidicanis]
MTNPTITDAIGSDPTALQDRAGVTGRMFISALDRAVHFQTSAIENYVKWVRGNNPTATPAQIQQIMDTHFKNLAGGAGGSAGAAAAIPGIGFLTGAAAIGAESLVFVDTAAFYTMASAHLRGVDIRNAERRRALILVALLGASGSAIIDAFVGDLSQEGPTSTASLLARFTAPKLGEVNNRLGRLAMKKVTKSIQKAWLGKIMPLGIGAVLGTLANRKLATKVIENARESFGPLPVAFAQPAPTPEETKLAAAEAGTATKETLLERIDPRDWKIPLFGKK